VSAESPLTKEEARELAKDIEADLAIIIERWNQSKRDGYAQVTVPRASLYRLLVFACYVGGIFQAISEGGIGVYQVLIPISTLKGLTGELIAREGRNEAEKLKAGAKIAVPKSRIIKPR
jgi:hypothetical protein